MCVSALGAGGGGDTSYLSLRQDVHSSLFFDMEDQA